MSSVNAWLCFLFFSTTPYDPASTLIVDFNGQTHRFADVVRVEADTLLGLYCPLLAHGMSTAVAIPEAGRRLLSPLFLVANPCVRLSR